MRIGYFILFIFLPFNDCFSQGSNTSVFHLNKLTPEGVLLDKGWRFHGGDDPAWTNPEFDDSQWQIINPTEDIHNLVQLRKAEVGWFRLRLKVDGAVLNTPLALLIKQIGASEFY